jgi:hypothetical protein
MLAGIGDFCGKPSKKASYRMQPVSGTFLLEPDSFGLDCARFTGFRLDLLPSQTLLCSTKEKRAI